MENKIEQIEIFNKEKIKKAFNENKLIDFSLLPLSDLKESLEYLMTLVPKQKLYKIEETIKKD